MWAGSNEWIELKNMTDEKIDVSNWIIENGKSGSGEKSNLIIPEDTFIKARGIILLAEKEVEEDVEYIKVSGISLKDSGERLTLKDDEGKTVDEAGGDSGWPAGEKSSELLSMERSDDLLKWHNYFKKSDEDENSGTPGKENSKPIEYSKKIIITEILPNPSGEESENEFIEFFNFDDKKINLKNWTLKDSSKTGKYIFPKVEINPFSFFAIYRKDFKFSLNNSGKETIYLIDPNGEEVSKAEYSGGKENVSHNFDGKKWRWSSVLTPGSQNIFDVVPEIKIKKDEKIYKDIYANFKAEIKKVKKKDLKIVWDFGDDHKSYLEEVRHKYEKEGKYQASLKVSTKSEDFIQRFTVKVEKYPKSNVEIVEIAPNPTGKDTETEWISVKNNSKKKINLNGWSVATGWENLYNHPIKKDFIIEPGKTEKITRDFCAFSLNNKQAKIELRYPNGKTASIVEYESINKSIPEGALLQKTENGWNWTGGIGENILAEKEEIEELAKETEPEENLEDEFIGGQSIDNTGEENRNKILNNNLESKKLSEINDKIILGAEIKKLNQREQNEFLRKNLARINWFINKSINFLMT